MYTKTDWNIGATPAINETNLDNIEGGIERAHLGTHIYGLNATGNDTYVLTFSPVLGSYNTGLIINIAIDVGNTSAATLNINSLGAKDLKKRTVSGKVTLITGDLTATGIYTLIYDGTDFVVLNPNLPYGLGDAYQRLITNSAGTGYDWASDGWTVQCLVATFSAIIPVASINYALIQVVGGYAFMIEDDSGHNSNDFIKINLSTGAVTDLTNPSSFASGDIYYYLTRDTTDTDYLYTLQMVVASGLYNVMRYSITGDSWANLNTGLDLNGTVLHGFSYDKVADILVAKTNTNDVHTIDKSDGTITDTNLTSSTGTGLVTYGTRYSVDTDSGNIIVNDDYIDTTPQLTYVYKNELALTMYIHPSLCDNRYVIIRAIGDNTNTFGSCFMVFDTSTSRVIKFINIPEFLGKGSNNYEFFADDTYIYIGLTSESALFRHSIL